MSSIKRLAPRLTLFTSLLLRLSTEKKYVNCVIDGFNHVECVLKRAEILGSLLGKIASDRRHAAGRANRANHNQRALKFKPLWQLATIDPRQKLRSSIEGVGEQSSVIFIPIFVRCVALTRHESDTQNYNPSLKLYYSGSLSGLFFFLGFMSPVVRVLFEHDNCYCSRTEYRGDRAKRLHPAGSLFVGIHPRPHRVERRPKSVDPHNGDNQQAYSPPRDHKTKLLHDRVTAQLVAGVQS